MKTVVVESPSKAKTINKYLGKDYHVLASFGHVRDLPAKNGSVKPDEDFAIIYQVDDDSKKHVSEIAKSVKKSDTLILATDPDREGEAISWHVLEALREAKALKKDIKIERVVFNEITKKAVTEAMLKPRPIDMDLVNAQQARRALDYLVGFTLSPVLWRKLPGAKSAGRVQSVALRLICERDEEIEKFISQEYWDIRAVLSHTQQPVKTRLTQWQGNKLEKFSITNETQAKSIADAIATKQFAVSSVEPKQVRRHPFAPFTTSTLQQEASRKLGFGAKKTMQLAQKLYEGIDIGGETVGLITYMRTDGVYVSQEAIVASRGLIGSSFGEQYLPKAPRMYKAKATNAQEAHEAIRPTDVARLPEQVAHRLDKDLLRLYELIWKRMIASQMESAVFDQVIVDFTSSDKQAVLHAIGSVMKFDGFLKLYREDKDDDEAEENEESRALPPLAVGDALPVSEVLPEQHFTEPPPRYSEASLVKKLEELGIGRPSTYASIISVLQERDYVRLDKKRFIAEPRGRLVNAFLVSFFNRYVQYDFTAQLEERLDEVSEGKADWKALLRDWWTGFIKDVDGTKTLTVSTVIAAVDALLADFIFKPDASGKDPRVCPKCGTGKLGIKTGRYGVFLGCSNYPECDFTKDITTGTPSAENGEISAAAALAEEKELGIDPATNDPVLLKKGPYGWYVQLGTSKKPKRASVNKTIDPSTVTLEQALVLLSMPRDIGNHPETGKPILAGIGRFGPYLLHNEKYTSLKNDDVYTIGMNRAVEVIATGSKGRGAAAEPLKVLGEHPDDKKTVAVYNGSYGPYVKHNKTNASLPKGADPETFTLEEAIPLLAARTAAPKKKGFKKKK